MCGLWNMLKCHYWQECDVWGKLVTVFTMDAIDCTLECYGASLLSIADIIWQPSLWAILKRVGHKLTQWKLY